METLGQVLLGGAVIFSTGCLVGYFIDYMFDKRIRFAGMLLALTAPLGWTLPDAHLDVAGWVPFNGKFDLTHGVSWQQVVLGCVMGVTVAICMTSVFLKYRDSKEQVPSKPASDSPTRSAIEGVTLRVLNERVQQEAKSSSLSRAKREFLRDYTDSGYSQEAIKRSGLALDECLRVVAWMKGRYAEVLDDVERQMQASSATIARLRKMLADLDAQSPTRP